MKLAEALAERADLDKKIAQLRERSKSAARFVENEEPPESSLALMTDTRALMKRRAELIHGINMTNSRTYVEWDGHSVTMTEALARRELLLAERNLVTEVADEATPGRDPYGRRRRTELPEKTDLPVAQLRLEADRLSRHFRELDTRIQQANWNTELGV